MVFTISGPMINDECMADVPQLSASQTNRTASQSPAMKTNDGKLVHLVSGRHHHLIELTKKLISHMRRERKICYKKISYSFQISNFSDKP